jgi:hypothetical protein
MNFLTGAPKPLTPTEVLAKTHFASLHPLQSLTVCLIHDIGSAVMMAELMSPSGAVADEKGGGRGG